MGISLTQFEIARPLCFAALSVLPILLLYWRWSLVHFSSGQRFLSLLVRTLLFVLIASALAGIKWTGATVHDTFVGIDAGSSQLDGGNAKDAFAQAAQETHSEYQCLDASNTLDTTVATTFAKARALMPTNTIGRIVLFSDGTSLGGGAIATAKAAGAPVDTVPLAAAKDEVYVAAVTAPSEVRQGEAFNVEVVVQSNHADSGSLQLARGADILATQTVQLIPGENRFHFPQIIAQGPTDTFTATISGCKDTFPANNQAGCIVLVGPRPKVLLVESQPVLARHLAEALKNENVDVEVRPPTELPGKLDDLQAFDLIILSNVPADALPADRMEALKSYVHDFGGGLVAVGGDQAFTPGGYRHTPLEDALPVISEENKSKPKPKLAMVLVLDISGSMNEGPKGNTKIDLAKQALRRAVETLGPGDQVGVLVFEESSHWIFPIGPVTDKQKIIDRINAIEANGETVMYPPMEQAYLALRESFADLKHMIVMTDGVSSPGDFDGLARQIGAAGITMSTVGVGDEPARPLLKRIAETAKGHAYFVNDATTVPKIFEMEVKAAGKIGITEEPFIAKVVHSTQVLRGLDFAHVPTLLGYVDTQAKPESQVVLATNTGEPVLALWRYGQGTTAAFTSDIQNRWAAAWLRWPSFGKFWVQLVRETMRKPAPKDFLIQTRQQDDRLGVTLDVVDASRAFVNGAEAQLTVIDPARKSLEVRFAQTAPGRYSAEVPAASTGAYLLEAKIVSQGRAIGEGRLGVVIPYAEEYRFRPPDVQRLKEIAQATGGRFDPKPAAFFAPSGKTVPRAILLWPYLLGATIGLFLIDLMLKRLTWGGKT